jgi:hydrogenase expression/formation protein HypE
LEKTVNLNHGSGGRATNELIRDLFLKEFDNDILNGLNDSAILNISSEKLAFTTDSFVVKPLFFRGGDIGKLAVCGTINDLAVSGAKPLYLSCSFIIEEGFPMRKLEQIVKSMACTARESGVKIVTGDTKVVDKGASDGIFINTSGIGEVYNNVNIKSSNAKVGDIVIINGTLGDHGTSIMCERNNLNFKGELQSDCAALNSLVESVILMCPSIHVMRDATRGGLAAVLNEIAEVSKVSIILDETSIVVKEEVQGVCEMLGLDPLYIPNEGKACFIVPEECAEGVLSKMKNHPLGINASIIGKVVDDKPYKVYMKTIVGGTRIVSMPLGDQFPRIC